MKVVYTYLFEHTQQDAFTYYKFNNVIFKGDIFSILKGSGPKFA
jgi:hypothetical protein